MNVRPILIGLLFAAGPLLYGCDSGGGTSGATATGMKPGPHGGIAVAIANGKAYAEVKVETPPKGKTATQSRMLVYFLDPELKAPLASAPTDISLKIIPPVGEPATLTVTPDPDAKDPLAKQRFASAPGNYDYDELKGEITASIDGQSSTQSFSMH